MKLVIVADGGCNNRSENHNAYFSFAVLENDQVQYRKHKKLPEIQTSMEAEWMAVLEALRYIERFEQRNPGIYPSWTICTDSQVVFRQMIGVYAVNAANLEKFAKEAFEFAARKEVSRRIRLKWIPREQVVPILGH